MELEGKKIAVVGGSGLLCKSLIQHFEKQNKIVSPGDLPDVVIFAAPEESGEIPLRMFHKNIPEAVNLLGTQTPKKNRNNRKDGCVDISIVIPAKNEEENLKPVFDEIQLLLDSSSHHFEVILIDDRSTDKTVETTKRYPFVTVVPSEYAPGKGGALRTGFDLAQGTFIVMMDADFSHKAADIPALAEAVSEHKGMVIGSRLTGGSEEYTKIRAFGNIFFTYLVGLLHGRYLSDALNGFKIFHRDIYHHFDYTATGFEIEIELLINTLRMNREVTEVPSRERSRLHGDLKSRVITDGLRFLIRILWEVVRRPRKK